MTAVTCLLWMLLSTAQDKPDYLLNGEAIEACECEAICGSVLTKDATLAQCRGNLVLVVTEGTYGKTDLKGARFAMTVRKSDRNMLKSMGKWEGAFAKLDVKSVPIDTKIDAERREATLG
jgi:hypothetical protein